MFIIRELCMLLFILLLPLLLLLGVVSVGELTLYRANCNKDKIAECVMSLCRLPTIQKSLVTRYIQVFGEISHFDCKLSSI